MKQTVPLTIGGGRIYWRIFMMIQEMEESKMLALDIQSDLNLACDAGVLEIRAQGREVRVRFSSLKIVFVMLKSLRKVSVLKSIDLALKKVDVTLYWGDSRFGILGSNGNRFLLLTLVGIQKVVVD